MSAPAETTAAMTPTVESEDPPASHADPSAANGPGDIAAAGAAPQTGRDDPVARKPLSPNTVVSLAAGLAVALLGVLGTLLALQLGALGDRIDALGNRIDIQGTELRAEIGSVRAVLRSEMGSVRSEMGSVRAEIGSVRAVLRSEIGSVRSEIGSVRAVLRSEIGGLRAEMQAGFREINATLLDHTDRLARLEAAVGLTRADGTDEYRP